MQLETYISDLLYRYDCVTVPEFGAFLSQRISAKMHESTHTFYPPKKLLSFNEQLQNNDGLLVNYIAEVEKIPYELALEKLSKQVRSIKSYLTEGETISFQNVGDLVLNAEGKMNFEPSYHINYLTDAFGLSHFNVSDIQRERYKKRVELIEDSTPIVLTLEKRKRGNWLKYAAAAVVFLALGGYGALSYYNGTVNTHNTLAQEEANEMLDTKVQEATFIISNPLPAATLNVDKQQGNYHIVAGAFRVKANSDKKVKQLIAQGYKARQIGVNRYGLHEVVYSSHTTRAEAHQALKAIRTTHNPEAWLLIKALD